MLFNYIHLLLLIMMITMKIDLTTQLPMIKKIVKRAALNYAPDSLEVNRATNILRIRRSLLESDMIPSSDNKPSFKKVKLTKRQLRIYDPVAGGVSSIPLGGVLTNNGLGSFGTSSGAGNFGGPFGTSPGFFGNGGNNLFPFQYGAGLGFGSGLGFGGGGYNPYAINAMISNGMGTGPLTPIGAVGTGSGSAFPAPYYANYGSFPLNTFPNTYMNPAVALGATNLNNALVSNNVARNPLNMLAAVNQRLNWNRNLFYAVQPAYRSGTFYYPNVGTNLNRLENLGANIAASAGMGGGFSRNYGNFMPVGGSNGYAPQPFGLPYNNNNLFLSG